MAPFAQPRRVLPTPRGATWLGVALILLGSSAQWLIFPATAFQGANNGVALDATFTVMRVLQMVALPLGIAFLAFSIVARAVVRTETLEVEDEHDDGPEEEREAAPRVFSSRAVFVAGIVLIVVGYLTTSYLQQWASAISGDAGLAQDFIFYVAPMIEPALLPLGILLVPCAWALRLLESRSVLSAIH